MILGPAPLHADIMHPSPGAAACWLRTDDGVRIRLATWRHGERGTVLLFNGRTEFIEKFGNAAVEFGARGFAFATLDWRGQGLSDTFTKDPSLCHIDDFIEFQADAVAARAALDELDMPRPVYLLAQSMGGCIGLRALHGPLGVNAALFSAPMWRIYLNRIIRRAASFLSTSAVRTGLSRRYVIGTDQRNYVHLANPGKNRLTSDPAMFTTLKGQLRAHPELSRGGPSYGWMYAAMAECNHLLNLEAPACDAHVLLGTSDRIVDPKAIRIICGKWQNAQLEMIPGARHELIMEQQPVRDHLFERAAAFFATYA